MSALLSERKVQQPCYDNSQQCEDAIQECPHQQRVEIKVLDPPHQPKQVCQKVCDEKHHRYDIQRPLSENDIAQRTDDEYDKNDR